MKILRAIIMAGLVGITSQADAEFLFTPAEPSPNGFFTPTLSFLQDEASPVIYEYSAWDIFYSSFSAPNYPDVFAPYGGAFAGYDSEGYALWRPETRTDANSNPDVWKPAGGFGTSPYYNPGNPPAFWDIRNPTITQTGSGTTFIIGPAASGNIYTFQQPTAYRLDNTPDYPNGLGTVLFQFQTDGTNVDFANIRLIYTGPDGNEYTLGINDTETEYLREYSTTDSGHWSATAGYRNRVLLQWDLSGIAWGEDGPQYRIEWESLSSSMSFQKADLLTADTYEIGMPVSSTWNGGVSGEWSDAGNWQGQSGSTPQENGNLKFKNIASPVTLDVDDTDHAVGEIIFDHAADVTIASTGNHKLIANTGVTTRDGTSDAVYVFDTDYELGALNFFEVNTGTVAMNGSISGGFGIVKLGEGTLEMNGNNAFTQFLAVQGGTIRIAGSNTYTGSTTIVNGRAIVATDASAFGISTDAITLGGDQFLYSFTTGADAWHADLLIEGDRVLSRNINLAAGDLGKRLGAFDTVQWCRVFRND